MVLVLLSVMGCQQDVVRVMGAVTGVVVNPRPPESPHREAKREPIPQVADASQPDAAGDAAGDAAAGDAETANDAGPPATAPAPSSFNPISMPEGPRDTPGVRWDGVRGHTQEAIAEERRLRKLDNP